MQKCYGVTIAGKVQDIGFRDLIDKKELSLEIPLPETFTKVNADDVEDIGRKLDKGNSELREINTTLSGVAQETHNLNIIMSSFVVEQRDFNKEMRGHNQRMDEHNQRMDKHNQRLERILEKLAEK